MDGQHGRQALLARLENSDIPAAGAQAGELREMYRARQMAALAEDVYAAARGAGAPPHGWVRASEDIGLLRELISATDMTDEELRTMFRPDRSGFRAEIYVPDPDVLGPDCKPTLVFKGSAGEVIGPDGSPRPTAAEDFLGNNFPQSIGLETDYYDRAMDLAALLQESGLDFDITGHSLGGGLAAASSAVTGMRAVTFNAAGLHPDTAARFARENGDLPLYDPMRTVTAWQVQGEVLNDGVQGDLAGLGARDRRRLAGIVSDVATVLRDVPEARGRLEQMLAAGIPEASHPAIHAFVDRLARGDADALLRDIPQAAGERRPPLVAMTAAGQALVAREEAVSVADLHRLAGPMLAVVSRAARTADAGRTLGELVEAGGATARDGLAWTGARTSQAWAQAGSFAGQGYRVAGVTIDHGLHSAGELAAQWRGFRSAAEAAAVRANGALQARGHRVGADGARAVARAAGVLPGDVGRAAQMRAEAAADAFDARAAQVRERADAAAADATARGRAAAGAYRLLADATGAALADDLQRRGESIDAKLQAAGERVEGTLHGTGQRIGGVTRRAPAAGAALGATSGLLAGSVSTYGLRPGSGYGVASTVRLARESGAALHEAVERHGMTSAVIPSLDAEIARREQAARTFLDRQAPARPAAAERWPLAAAFGGGESGRALAQFLDALRADEPARISAAAGALLDTPAARQWLQAGQARLDARAPELHEVQQAQETPAHRAPELLPAR